MPLRLSDEDKSLKGAMEVALSEGLQQTYTVFSGDKVQQKAKEIFNNESKIATKECDETKCMQDIAIAFQSELIAVANVTKRDKGYFLALSIQNIFDNKVVYARSIAYKNADNFELIDRLKELVRIPKNDNLTVNIDKHPTEINEYSSQIWSSPVSGLMWKDNANVKTDTKSWQDAMDYCENLNYAGYDDWFLPDQHMLFGLYFKNFGHLKNLAEDLYWTSSETSKTEAKRIFFNDVGGRNPQSITSGDKNDRWYVRCVRKMN